MPSGCENTCPKVKQKARSTPNAARIEDLNGSSKSVGKSISNNRRSPSASQKSVQIGGVTSFQSTDNYSAQSSHTSTESASISYREPTTPEIQRQYEAKSSTRSIPPQDSKPSSNHSRMSSKGGNSSRSVRADWNPNGHDPCPPSCPMTQARERAQKKAELRQERLDEYLLTKGFSYFDDLCTCSSLCLFNQLRRDKFVLALLKSVFVFGLGIKLCEELDSMNIIG